MSSSSSSSSSSSYYTPTQKLLLFLQVLTTCSLSLLTQFTLKQNTEDPSNTKFAYNSLTVPFFAELGKLVLSLVLFYWTREERTTSGMKPTLDTSNQTVFMAAIPASLYAISNNLNFFVIADLGAFSYQMLNQLKIVVTACAFKIMMKKHLTKLQWRMMILLTVGCMISQLGAKEGGSGEHVRFADDRHIFAGGDDKEERASPYSSMSSLASSSVSSVLDNEEERTKRRMLLASSFSDYGRLTQGYVLESFAIVARVSSIAGVCVEMFLKNTANPFYFQNALLYGWGTMITFASLVWETNAFENGVHYELFRGHTLVSLALVANSAFGGIAASA